MKKRYLALIEYATLHGVAGVINPIGEDTFNKYPEWRGNVLQGDYPRDDSIPHAIKSRQHLCGIVAAIKTWKIADYEIVILPYMHAEEWLDDNYKDVYVISMSSGFFNEWWLQKYENDCYIVQAGGNDGISGEMDEAHNTFNSAVVSAVNEKFELEWYSSFGEGMITHAGIVRPQLTINDGYNTYTVPFKGTSEATPQHANQVMTMMCAFDDLYNRKPIIKSEVVPTVRKYTRKLHTTEESKNLKTGYGYYEYKECELVHKPIVTMKIGSTAWQIDGVPQKPMEISPRVENGRTLTPVRYVAEGLGAKVGWDQATQTITIQ